MSLAEFLDWRVFIYTRSFPDASENELNSIRVRCTKIWCIRNGQGAPK